MATVLAPDGWLRSKTVSFALLILVLLVMPTGILGRPEVEKV
jgi:branched-subunit amino acid ABC-type transport system permease component